MAIMHRISLKLLMLKGANRMNVKEMDVALIFMLEEEKRLFLDANHSFIILDDGEQEFTEFIFFDKNFKKRMGVICSSTNSMGNTEAGILFFKLSRKYKAHLYINIGVSCHISDIQIGDVLICNRISTLGENNANNSPKQPLDLSINYNNLIAKSIKKIGKISKKSFLRENKQDVSCFINRLQDRLGDLDRYQGLNNLESNEIKGGWCVTVSEVIKDRKRFFNETPLRKVNVIDMEAYYFGKWIQVINDNDPEHSCSDVKYMAFKSVSDYGDDNKAVMEECGSRILAMKNLCFAVCSFCNEVYDFPTESNMDLYSYFTNEICEKSLDKAVPNYDCVCNQIQNFESTFSYFIYSDSVCFDTSKCINSAVSLLEKKNKALFLTGRSGTGKSTFISVLYKYFYKLDYKTILVDFSKFGEKTIPNERNLLFWLKRLIESQNELFFLLDGISVGSNSYQALKEIFNSAACDKVSFCVGKYNKELGGSLYETISARNDITDVIFYSVNVNSPYFESYVSKCLNFFNYFGTEQVKKFITDSKVCSVDFRFLYMASQDESLNSRKLHTFVKKYVSDKFEITNISEYSQFRKQEGEKYHKINTNSYSRALAIVSDIVNMFSEEQNEDNILNSLSNGEFILSNDMNIMLEEIICAKNERFQIIKNILNFLSNNDVDISYRTQLLYTACKTSFECRNEECIEKVKQLVNSNVANVENSLKSCLKIPEKMNNILSLRTMSILHYFFFHKEEELASFNKMMLKDACYLSCNLHFHLFYYSKLEFVFSDLVEFDKKNIDYEMFHNTYYILDDQLNIGDRLFEKLILKDSFVIMNIITFFDLLQNISKDRFVNFLQPALERVQVLLSAIEKVNAKVGSFYSDLIPFAKKIQTYLIGLE